MKKIDLIGQKFGRLTAVRDVGASSNGRLWLCCCVCGQDVVVRCKDLRSGSTMSCGCWQREIAGSRMSATFFKHGHTAPKSPEYTTWTNMVQRCTNPHNSMWPYYGGANPPVKIDLRWLGDHGFENFLADMGSRPEGTTLGRFLDSGNYKKSNCEWQTQFEQGAQRSGKAAATALHNRRPVRASVLWVWKRLLKVEQPAAQLVAA